MMISARWILALGLIAASGCQGRDDGNNNSDGGGGGGGNKPDLAMRMAGLCDTPPGDVATAKRQAQGCGIGAGAPFFLRAAPYSKILIEINATVGAAPRQAAIDHLKKVMEDVCGKPGAVTAQVTDAAIAAPGHALTVDDVRALEDAHRTRFNGGDTVVFYYLVVSDPSSDDTNQAKVLGLAHRASSMVIFQGTIDKIAGGIGQPSRETVESTVVAHELGHVLGLVNIGTKMTQPHEDAMHPGHDANTKCLMYWANNSSSLVANLLQGGVVADFDAACRADLAAARAGN